MPLPLPVSPAALAALADEHGTPLQLYDERGMRENCRALLRAFRGAFGASFRQFFAVKALPNPAVLRVLIDDGFCHAGAAFLLDRLRLHYPDEFKVDADVLALTAKKAYSRYTGFVGRFGGPNDGRAIAAKKQKTEADASLDSARIEQANEALKKAEADQAFTSKGKGRGGKNVS